MCNCAVLFGRNSCTAVQGPAPPNKVRFLRNFISGNPNKHRKFCFSPFLTPWFYREGYLWSEGLSWRDRDVIQVHFETSGRVRDVIFHHFFPIFYISPWFYRDPVTTWGKTLAMKQILYNTVSQTMVNRAVHSKERREKGLFINNIWKSRTQWSILLTNLAKSDPINKNIEQ